MRTNVDRIQAALRAEGIDGWLLYDFHGSNPVAGAIIGLPREKFLTRRWYYFIPANGEPPGAKISQKQPGELTYGRYRTQRLLERSRET